MREDEDDLERLARKQREQRQQRQDEPPPADDPDDPGPQAPPEPNPGDPGAQPPPKDATDEDKIALEFSALHANDMRYVAAWGRWYQWDGACWRHETTLQAFDEARVLVRAAPIKKKAQVVSAVVTLARADRRQAATADQWDTDPWLLGTPGGTVELRTGKLRAARPLDYITKQTAVAPKRMPTPLWTAYLEKVTAGDKDLQAFLQRWAGYSFTGSTVEHALLFLYGRGKNGKSTFLETISRILGDYHQKADMELLNASKFARHSTEVAVLRGARMVTAIETGEEKSWDEAKIKALTGGDTLSARFMRQDPFSFLPQFKLTIGGNHKPVIRTVDEAIRRRFIMATFTVTIPEEERDKDLGEKLKAEWPGILAWLIDGCLEWQRVGLAKPQAVLDTTATYLEAQDVLQDFLDTCCAVGKTESDTFQGIWDGWTDYCDDCRESAGTKKAFGQKLQDKGFMHVKGGKGVHRYQGLRCMRENMKKLLAQAALKRKGKT
jgi:putative DNA primase/helicase